jgi:hypothetical protein
MAARWPHRAPSEALVGRGGQRAAEGRRVEPARSSATDVRPIAPVARNHGREYRGYRERQERHNCVDRKLHVPPRSAAR